MQACTLVDILKRVLLSYAVVHSSQWVYATAGGFNFTKAGSLPHWNSREGALVCQIRRPLMLVRKDVKILTVISIIEKKTPLHTVLPSGRKAFKTLSIHMSKRLYKCFYVRTKTNFCKTLIQT